MNSVSWFIYIAQISNSLGEMFIAFGVSSLVGVGLAWGFPRVFNAMECNRPDDRDYWTPPPFRSGYVAAAICFLVVGNLMPEKNTMYAIAASQVGEQIVKTEIASDATKALHQWIKKQIEPKAKD